MYIKTKTMPEIIKKQLSSVGYGADDIDCESALELSLASYAGQGQKGFAIVLNMLTGESKHFNGSWGGSNMFTKTVVDDVQDRFTLPEGCVIIKGCVGYPRTFATVYAHPSVINSLALNAPKKELTENESFVLGVYSSYKAAYRKDYLTGRYSHRVNGQYVTKNFTLDELNKINLSLAEKGLIKINKAGAISVTTEGKNH